MRYLFVSIANECVVTDPSSALKAGSLVLYTMEWSSGAEYSFYHVLNQALRAEDRSKVKMYFSVLRLLFEAMNKLPAHRGTFHRGVKKDLSAAFVKDNEVVLFIGNSLSFFLIF